MKLSDESKAALWTCGVPEHMHDGIIDFYEKKLPPGGFLKAVIDNNLKEAFARADHINQHCIRAYVMWFYNHAPGGSWGFTGATDKWISSDESNT